MFKKIYFFYFTYQLAALYSQTLFYLWFLDNGVSYEQFFIYFVVMYVSALLFIFVLHGRSVPSQISMPLGIITSALAVLVANFMPHPYHIFIVAFLFGINVVLFWTFYNVLHFRYSEKHEHGLKSGAYYLFFPVLTMILAPATGLIVEKFGYHFLFVTSMIFYAIPFIFSFYIPKFDFNFDIKDALVKTQYPLLIFLQGYIFMLTFNILPVFALFFITTPFKLGGFFGYLAIFAAIAGLFNAGLSDRLMKRASFFYIFATLNALSYLPLFLSRSLAHLQIFSGINNLTYGLSNPFNLTLVLDYSKQDIAGTMLGREIYYTFGKVFMLLTTFIFYSITLSMWTTLVWIAVVPILYPIIAFYQKVYLTK